MASGDEAQVHPSIIVGGVKVFFPFEPYNVQREYMHNAIKAFSSSKNALLESPTGTGKTLSLVCSSLAWLTASNRTDTLIYYTSRTHKQLDQAAKEMKRTAYRKVPSVVIGSRSQLCINDDVRNSQGDHLINRACRNAISKNACSFYTNYEQKLETMSMDTVNDIEDLCKFGRSHQCCPYYAAKKIAEVKATLVFMPYNYMLDATIRKTMPLKLKSSIVIFDEAHNIQSSLRDCVSASIRISYLKTVIQSCLEIPSKLASVMNNERYGLSRNGYDPESRRGGIVDELSSKKSKKVEKEPKISFMEELAEKLTTEKLEQVRKSTELLKLELERETTKSTYSETDVYYRYLRNAGIEYATSDPILSTLDSMTSFWSTAGVMSPDKVANYLTALGSFSNLISLLYPVTCFRLQLLDNHKKELLNHYKAYSKLIYEDGSPLDRGGKIKDIELNIWCLNPAIGLRQIFNKESMPRSLIFTSGTLAPIESMARALELVPSSFLMESLPHVIDPKQMKILLLEKSLNSYSLRAKHEDAEKPQYSHELGKTLVPILGVLPFGTLVFFPSYARLKKVTDSWKRSTIWRDMERQSKLFIEMAGHDEFENNVENFKRAVSSEGNTKAVFFGVCRGKLSEGTNLKDNQCRTVIIAGLPHPNSNDPRVRAMRTYRDAHGNPDGSMWYSEQMRQALYQTVGRAIRSRSDFGLLLLCDPRFAFCKQGAPKWMESSYPTNYTTFDKLETEIKLFFQEHNISITGSLSKKLDAFELASPRLTKGTAPNGGIAKTSLDRSALPAEPDRRTAEDRQRDMLKTYTVDSETYKRIRLDQETRKKEQIKEELVVEEPCESTETPSMMDRILQDNNSQPEYISAPKKSLNIFRKKSTAKQKQQVRSEPTSQSQACSSIGNYSILSRPIDTNGPAKYRCYICKNPATDPHRTECPCQHSGCRSCLLVLDGKNCGTCRSKITARSLKKLYFKSATFSTEKDSITLSQKTDKD